MSETDTRYFDSEFTGESVELTPPDADGPTDISTIAEVDETTFPGFSYQGCQTGRLKYSIETVKIPTCIWDEDIMPLHCHCSFMIDKRRGLPYQDPGSVMTTGSVHSRSSLPINDNNP